MTGHGSDDRRPATYPETGASAAADSVLDLLLNDAASELRAALRAQLDLDAGLAAVYAAMPGAARGRDGEQAVDGDSPAVTGTGGGELEAVCRVLAGWAAELETVAAPGAGTPPGLGASVSYLAAVHRLVVELGSGLLARSVDRAGAGRLLRLIEHNAREAGQLLAGERHRTRRRIRVESWIELATAIRDGVGQLRPRVLALFDDAGEAVPGEPRPRLPV